MTEVDKILSEAGITPTPVRLMVYKCLANSKTPMSLSDLEDELESIDKSTISRTLSTFKNSHLLHSFNDGSGSVKYEICYSSDHGTHNDMHVHFHCEKCGETICLPDVSVPHVDLPHNYVSHEVSYLIKGLCPKCR